MPAILATILTTLAILAAGPGGVRAATRPTPTSAPSEPLPDPYPGVAAAYLVVLDGRPLWGHALQARHAPASLTKLLAALVLLEADWNPDALVMIDGAARRKPRPRLDLPRGARLRAADALTAMLMHSDNDACRALVDHTGLGVTAFVARMNARARVLGMRHSHFVTPCGLDAPGQYSTVPDLLRLAQAAELDPRIARIVRQAQASFRTPAGQAVTLTSTNLLLGRLAGALGMKTGYTAQAGDCLIALAQRGQTRVWLVMLGAKQRWWSAHRIISDAFRDADRGTLSVSTH